MIDASRLRGWTGSRLDQTSKCAKLRRLCGNLCPRGLYCGQLGLHVSRDKAQCLLGESVGRNVWAWSGTLQLPKGAGDIGAAAKNVHAGAHVGAILDPLDDSPGWTMKHVGHSTGTRIPVSVFGDLRAERTGNLSDDNFPVREHGVATDMVSQHETATVGLLHQRTEARDQRRVARL